MRLQFPKDKDLEFAVLRRELDGQLAGLPTILKNMKGKKMVDYRDNFIKCVHTASPTLTSPAPQ